MNLVRHLLVAIIVILILLFAGTTGYRLIEGWSLLDALYMTVITITTVGYGEIQELSKAGKIFTVFLILSSFGIMGYVLGGIAQNIIAGQIRAALGRRKLEKKVKRLKNHYVLCSYGRIGSFIAREVKREDVPFVIMRSLLLRAGLI